MDRKGSLHGATDVRKAKDVYVSSLNAAAQTVVSNDGISIQGVIILYSELLHFVKTMFTAVRLESFGEAYIKFQENLNALLHDKLRDLD